MTTDELIEKLESEFEKINSNLPEQFEALGRAVYEPLNNTITGLFRSDVGYETSQIQQSVRRMNEIRQIQKEIRFEADRK